MKSNGPTRRDKFAEAWAKLEDITKKKTTRKRGKRGEGREEEMPVVGVHDSFLKCPSQEKKSASS